MATTSKFTFTRASAAVTIAFAVGIPLVLVVALSGGDDDSPIAIDEPASSDGSSILDDFLTPTLTHGIAKLDCRTLWSDDEVEWALSIAARDDESGIFTVSKSEACTEEIAGDPGYFVEISPGSATDFLAGARLLGVEGEPVADFAPEALWFGGDLAEGDGTAGVLSARWGTSVGVIQFRVTVGRPDQSSDSQLEIAKYLALSAILRFPAVEVLEPPEPEPEPEPDPVVISFEQEPADLSAVSYADNLLTRQQDGEWTLGEGVVATLQLFAGEIDSTDVLRHPELVDFSGTNTIQIAIDYRDHGPDEAARSEVTRLLDELLVSGEDLVSASTLPVVDETASEPTELRLASFARPISEHEEPPEIVSQEWCMTRYGIDAPCLIPRRPLAQYGEKKYTLYEPKPGANGGWSTDEADAAVAALVKAATRFEDLTESGSAKMPSIVIYLTPIDEPGVTTWVDVDDQNICVIHLHPFMQEYEEKSFQQFIARDIAYCLISETYSGQWGPGHAGSSWWSDGLATYLSDDVYKDVNLEHENLPTRLEDTELSTTLFQRRFTNWAFFEHMSGSVGTEGILVRAGRENIDAQFESQWHRFNELLSDGIIQDQGSTEPGFDPNTETATISGPTTMTPSPLRYGMARGQLLIDGGSIACMSYTPSGEVSASFRYGIVGSPDGAWSTSLPGELSADAVFIVTATESGAQLTIEVTKVINPDDDEECKEEEEEEEEDDGGSLGSGSGSGSGASDGDGSCEIFCDESGYYLVIDGYEIRLFEDTRPGNPVEIDLG